MDDGEFDMMKFLLLKLRKFPEYAAFDINCETYCISSPAKWISFTAFHLFFNAWLCIFILIFVKQAQEHLYLFGTFWLNKKEVFQIS